VKSTLDDLANLVIARHLERGLPGPVLDLHKRALPDKQGGNVCVSAKGSPVKRCVPNIIRGPDRRAMIQQQLHDLAVSIDTRPVKWGDSKAVAHSHDLQPGSPARPKHLQK